MKQKSNIVGQILFAINKISNSKMGKDKSQAKRTSRSIATSYLVKSIYEDAR